MAQNWTDDVFASSHNAQTDLQNMENNFQTIKSLFEGSTTPSNTVAGMPWFDSSKDLLRVRNAANGSWYGLMQADASQQIWIYRNDAMSGWLVVTSVTDKVLAIKGGTNAYDVVAGQTAGTWTQPGHTLAENEIPSHTHSIGVSINAAGSHIHSMRAENTNAPETSDPTDNYLANTNIYITACSYCAYMASDMMTSEGDHIHSASGSAGNTGGGYSHNHGSTYRPAAAVGTLQRMDV